MSDLGTALMGLIKKTLQDVGVDFDFIGPMSNTDESGIEASGNNLDKSAVVVAEVTDSDLDT